MRMNKIYTIMWDRLSSLSIIIGRLVHPHCSMSLRSKSSGKSLSHILMTLFYIYMHYQNISKNPPQHNTRKGVEQNGKKW